VEAIVLSMVSVALALASLAYAYRVATKSETQVELLKIQTDELKTQTDRISEMTERLSHVSLNLGQSDYFLLRTLVTTTGSEPVFDDQGALTGYTYEDERGSATLTFRRVSNETLIVDVSVDTYPP
jgi:hypothetical protein